MGWVASRLNEFDKGQFVISKGWGLYSTVILLKLFDAVWWLYIVCGLLMVPATWFLGWLIIKSGIWAAFTRATNEGLKTWFKKEE